MIRNIPSIHALSESLIDNNHRLRTLRGLIPVTDATGQPIFKTDSRYVTFAVTLKGVPFQLTCLPQLCETERFAIETAAAQTHLQGSYLLPCTYKPEELFTNDSIHGSIWTDLLLQPVPSGGTDLTDFVRSHLFKSNRKPLRSLLENIARMSRTLAEKELFHGNIKRKRLFITPNGEPILADYALSPTHEPSADLYALAGIALYLFIAACQPNLIPLFNARKEVLTRSRFNTIGKHLLTQAEFMRSETLIRIIDSMYCPEKPGARDELNLLLVKLARTAFSPMPLLNDLILSDRDLFPDFIEVPSQRPVTNYSSAAAETDLSLRIDPSECDYTGPVCDTLICYCKKGAWNYIDCNGTRLCDNDYLFAGDFYEGRAVVRDVSGFGLIDREGKEIMPCQYEDMDWYGPENVVAASIDGNWHLYDRCGNRITNTPFDFIGDCNEGLFIVRNGIRWGFLRADGSLLTPLAFEQVTPFTNRKATVVRNGERFEIDTTGKRTIGK